jgi:hypothetical protein
MAMLPRNLGDLVGIRRVVHIVLLVLIVMGVRACGGATQTEDRLNATTRWMAEKTGLTGAKEAWDATVWPPLVAVARTTSDVVYGAVYGALNAAEAAVDGVASWVADRITRLMDGLWNGVASLFTPRQKPQPIKPDGTVPPPNAQPPAAR